MTQIQKDQQNRYLKVGVIVWTNDPDNKPRFLLRHNRPFDGHEDEWTIVFGGVDLGESIDEAALREISEEFGIWQSEETLNLDYTIEYEGSNGTYIIHFYAVKVAHIDIPVILNEESIGFDWVLHEDVKRLMQHDDEKKAFDVLLEKVRIE